MGSSGDGHLGAVVVSAGIVLTNFWQREAARLLNLHRKDENCPEYLLLAVETLRLFSQSGWYSFEKSPESKLLIELCILLLREATGDHR